MNSNNKGAIQAVETEQLAAAANDPHCDGNYKLSPVAEVHPRMSEEAFKLFKDDIEKYGLLEPIVVHNGMIIDGRHRYLACKELNITPKFLILDNTVDALTYSTSMNMHRRHLSDMDKVLLANSLGSLGVGSNQHTATAVCSQAKMAALLNTSADTLQRGNKILKQGCPELQQAVKEGRYSISVGAEISSMSMEDQRESLAKGEIATIRKAGKVLTLLRMQEQRTKKTNEMNAMVDKAMQLDGTHLYSVIYADPPWDYLGFDGTPYPTMPLADICALPVKDICTDDAVAFIWVPSAMVPGALEVIKAWGFEYITTAVWDKQTAGQGVYFRQQHEFLFIATKGHPPIVDPKLTPASVITGGRKGHSRKPHCVYDMIETMYPGLAKVELFSRDTREGWTMLGNQAGSMTSKKN